MRMLSNSALRPHALDDDGGVTGRRGVPWKVRVEPTFAMPGVLIVPVGRIDPGEALLNLGSVKPSDGTKGVTGWEVAEREDGGGQEDGWADAATEQAVGGCLLWRVVVVEGSRVGTHAPAGAVRTPTLFIGPPRIVAITPPHRSPLHIGDSRRHLKSPLLDRRPRKLAEPSQKPLFPDGAKGTEGEEHRRRSGRAARGRSRRSHHRELAQRLSRPAVAVQERQRQVAMRPRADVLASARDDQRAPEGRDGAVLRRRRVDCAGGVGRSGGVAGAAGALLRADEGDRRVARRHGREVHRRRGDGGVRGAGCARGRRAAGVPGGGRDAGRAARAWRRAAGSA